MIRIFTILYLLLILTITGYAQTRAAYTRGSTLLIAIESNTGLYEYTTTELLVRYNENTKRVECIFNINSLLPANDSSPVVIAQDIFFAAKYPEQLIEIDAPDVNSQLSTAAPPISNRKASIMFHSMPIELIIPVAFSPDLRTLLFSSTFDVMLPDYKIPIPARYHPILTGRIIYTFRNAKWVNMQTK